MANTYRWTPTAGASDRVSADDVASVAGAWVAATYDDLRRAGPDRGARIRRVLESYVISWFDPQAKRVGDITYVMVHQWLLTLVGRRPSGETDKRSEAGNVENSKIGAELSLKEAAAAGQVSLATARRRWHDGELVGRYRNSYGHVRVPDLAVAALQTARREQPAGLSQPVVADALWVLRPRTGLCSGERAGATRLRSHRRVERSDTRSCCRPDASTDEPAASAEFL